MFIKFNTAQTPDKYEGGRFQLERRIPVIAKSASDTENWSLLLPQMDNVNLLSNKTARPPELLVLGVCNMNPFC